MKVTTDARESKRAAGRAEWARREAINVERKRGKFLGEVLWHLIDLLKQDPIPTMTRTA